MKRKYAVLLLVATLGISVLATSTALALAPTKTVNFALNVLNSATAKSSLQASIADPVLSLINNASGAALDLQTQQGTAPMTVSSNTKVDNLNADQVDGQSFTCPSNSLLHEGACIEASDRGVATTWTNADADCADEHARLPSAGELQTFHYPPEQDFMEWTSLTYSDSGQWKAVAYYQGSNVRAAFDANYEMSRYRCVVPLN